MDLHRADPSLEVLTGLRRPEHGNGRAPSLAD